MKKSLRNSNSLKDYFFSHFVMTKRQRSGFFSLLALIIVAELIIQFYPFEAKNTSPALAFTPSQEALLLKEDGIDKNISNVNSESIDMQPFNPNALDEKGFMELGFSEKQAKSLIKYRYTLGGNFANIEEFGAAYVVSDRMLEKLKPYIQIKPYAANKYDRQQKSNTYSNAYSKSYETKKKLQPFDPNQLNIEGWIELGFSERQVPVILKYKKSLPNERFDNVEQIKSCFVINDYMFDRIKPFVRIKKLSKSEKYTEDKDSKEPIQSKLNPNQMKAKDWENLGWDKESATNIIKYKEFVGGFNNLEDLEKCKYISVEQIEKIRNRLTFE